MIGGRLRLIIFLAVAFAYVNPGRAFFLNWGSNENPQIKPQPWPIHPYYQQRYLVPQYHQQNEAAPIAVPLPSIPMQMPLQAQMNPMGNIHNVQLVPCLCPVAQDEMDKNSDKMIGTKSTIQTVN